jgi:hypothetical protein
LDIHPITKEGFMRKFLATALILGFMASNSVWAQAHVGKTHKFVKRTTHHNPHKPGPRSNSEPAQVPVKH